MIDATNLSVDNKAVKWMTFNGSIVYSTTEDQTTPVWSTENTTLQTAGYDATTGTYTPPGDSSSYTYYTCPTTDVEFVEAGSGSNHLFPIAPHVWCRAKHYASTIASFTFGGSTYNVTEQTGLTTWAEQNNIEIPADGLDDIEVLTTTQAVDSSKVPYLMPYKQFQGTFHRDALKGLVGYVVPQTTNKPQPIVFTNDVSSGETRGECQWSTPQILANLVPDDYTYMKSMNPTYLGTGGDSGRPVFIYLGNAPVIVSHNHQIVKPAFSPTAPYFMSGPNYTKAFPLLKAYVESKGDTIKTLEG